MPKKKILSSVEKISQWLTESIGTNTSILIHTVFFIGIFGLTYFGISLEKVLLLLTTVVSLEAIYLSLLIQMSVNRTSQTISVVEENIEDIQEDVEDIQEDIEDIQEDVDEEEEIDTAKILSNIDSQLNVLKEEITQLKKKVN